MKRIKSINNWEKNSERTTEIGTFKYDENCEAVVSDKQAELMVEILSKATYIEDSQLEEDPIVDPVIEEEVIDPIVIDPVLEEEVETKEEETKEEETEEETEEEEEVKEAGEVIEAPTPLSDEEKVAMKELLAEKTRDELKEILNAAEVEYKKTGSNEYFIDSIIENNLV